MEVHSHLGPGYLEAVYQDALAYELGARVIPHEQQVELPVVYKGHRLGAPYKADFLCYGEILLELKAKRDLSEVDRNQIVHYLKTSGLSLGLLLNFGEARLDYQRFIFLHKQSEGI